VLGWPYLAFERWVRAKPARTARHLNRVPVAVVKRIAREKLARTLGRVWDRSPAQRERWQAAGVRRRDLRWPETLERLPFTTGDDLSARPADFFCVPESELIHVLSTSGTKGRPKRVWLTAADFRAQMASIGSNYRRFPHASRGMAIFDVTNPTWCAGPIARRGFEAAGMFALLSGAIHAAADHVALIREYRIDTVISTPTSAVRIARECAGELRGLGVRWLLLSGQPWGEDTRRELEAAWGAKAVDVYASTEFVCGAASECVEQEGLHLNEADLWAEVIDPATGRTLGEGAEGELVLTTLERSGMPLVRYRTGDFASLLAREERCRCGSPLRRISRVRGRVDDMLIVGAGNNVYPDEFDRALLALPGVTDYQVVLERANGFCDVLSVTVEAAPSAGLTREAVASALFSIHILDHSCREEHTLALGAIHFAAPGSLCADGPRPQGLSIGGNDGGLRCGRLEA
jgi:phenylacetate-CoA ligase